MIKILMGEKGTGKTKVLTDMVNKAASVADGMVVCINKGNRLMHDVDIGVRLVDTEEFGVILRAKGMVEGTDGKWIYFDMVPGEYELRDGEPDYTGRLVVIGTDIHEHELEEIFGIA